MRKKNNIFSNCFIKTAGVLLSILLLLSFLTGCGERNTMTASIANSSYTQGDSTGVSSAALSEEPPAETVKASEAAAEATPAKVSEEASEEVSVEASASENTGSSLAKRLCGKYSRKTDDSEESEYAVLEIVEFADNLYAFGGDSMDEEGVLEAYSFWAMEFLPEDAAVLSSADADSCNVGVLTFSIMSNLGRYWSAPQKETIRLTDDGVIINGDHYLRDERVSDTFPYLIPDGKGSAGSGKLDGLWKERGSSSPHYLRFSDGVLTIYRKTADQEVFFGRGGYETDGKCFRCTYNTLGCGTMPYSMETAYSVGSNGLLTLNPTEDDLELFDRDTVFEPIVETAVPIITLSDAYQAGLTEDRHYLIYDLPAETDDNPFYGVWVSAYPSKEEAEKDLKKLEALDLPACVILSSDWKNLNRTPYYCVTAGRFDSEADANVILERVKSAGYPNAYVKHSGNRIGF
ncbi:MAG: SPOR domain-containing protein [Lachnospiraceae bacterium]|nr:SPOR domain-containing protein [Lachnospiraceae bacterium]